MAATFDTLECGFYSGISDALEVAVTSQDEWSSLWERHTSGQSPPPPLPDIPFNTDMVICVFCGERSSGGHSVAVKSIDSSGGGLSVVYEVSSPPPGAMTTCAVTQPHHIVRLQRTDLPVTFTRKAAPPPAPSARATFLLTFDAAKKEEATALATSLEGVSDSRSMFGGDILCVTFDTSVVAVELCQERLQGIDGVLSVEKD
eukprot:CAMPEP_0179063408 /NCGR_PEP_ID=MMETSP0796-20121207/27419_1 /TAXON_ID=73915 /ORGANISM="Pyrodinium bahamense, Strain pbaha01" /LENGTH=201 /DNA_ID=CAMNT_0020760327 /DNA_START=58 /DNA_END=663 /DNA_ORIENTATION=-